MSIRPKVLYGEPEELPEERYDVLVIGGGIAGMQASLDLGNMGYKVLLVDKEPTIGGHMFKLSKTFPTMDCASCISTPRMAEVSHHPNVKLMTYSEVKEVWKDGEGNFRIRVFEKPKYVDPSTCTGCQECEFACPVIVSNEYDWGLSGRKAAFIPFDTAVPRIAMIDMDNCVFCGQCERACPADSIDFLQRPKWHTIRVKTVILATGFHLFPIEKKLEYGFGKYANVITSMQMERILAPTTSWHAIVRPGDGKEPSNIAYVLCAGSRDRTLGNPYCSQVCCMYSIKQAQLIAGALPLADVTIYYMDIRAYGKRYEEFFQQAKDMGIRFIKGRVAKIEDMDNGDLMVYYEDIENGGRLSKAQHDLVVLSIGLLSNPEIAGIFKNTELKLDMMGWIASPDENVNPVRTSIPGIFAAGTAIGPKDIPDSVVEGSAAAMEAAAYIEKVKAVKPVPAEARSEG